MEKRRMRVFIKMPKVGGGAVEERTSDMMPRYLRMKKEEWRGYM